jgi:predicted O-methyltransferase YrrM
MGHAQWTLTKKEAEIVYAIVKTVKPKVAIETGTFHGYSTCYISKALEEDALLTTVEILPSLKEVAAKNFKLHNLNNVNPVIQDSVEFLSGFSGEIDFALIDDDHAYGYVETEFGILKNKMHSKSVLVFHDAHAMEGVKRFLRDITDHEVLIVDTERGLGVVKQ